ncbi:RNA-directed DNA polymerase, eukaryota [Tanacetum coccineum]
MGSFNQNSLQSNIDQASKISNSVYVSNSPDGCTAKELWNVCNGYGTVVDVFIPAKKSKIGKRFAFVRFIKVHNLNRLIENLNTIWMGRYHLFANPARFVRPPKVNSFNQKEGSVKNTRTGYNNTDHHFLKDKSKENGRALNSKSYVDVINNDFHQKKENYPAIVLDESCMNTVDYSLALMGKVKEFSALTNLKMVLANKGFESINLKYLGGFWVLIEFKSEDSKKKFNSKMGNGSWFAQLIQASNSFCIDERVSWIDIEGLPLKAWTKNTFNRITSKWGELLYLDEQVEGYFHSKRVCVKTKLVDNICESVKIIIQGKTYWVRAKEVTGWIPDFEDDNEDSSSSDEELSNDDVLDDNGNLNNDSKMEDDSDLEEVAETIFEQHETNADDKGDNIEESLKYPPGFTPDIDIDAQINSPKGVEVEDVIHDSNENTEGASSGIKQNSGPNNTKVGSEKSVCSRHFKKDFVSKSGGSILQVMEELIKVSQTMGYNMEGCLAQKAKKDWVQELCDKHNVSFLSLQETKMENIDQFNIKLSWGNYGFDSSISPSVGNSGGILCVWDPRLFHKTNVTISDYLIIIQGVWIPSGKKTAIISIYAPQDIRDKKLLWEYLSLVISNWKGDVIVMGDFNEVRSPNERYGSVFNSQGANIFNQFISSASLEELPLGGCKYTWCHKTGTKMSKLDRFLISDGLWRCYPDMSSITLDQFLSDHRPILMRESHHDYGPTPFRFYHYWFDLEGFDKFMEETWMNAPQDDTNALVKLTKKLRYLKQHIRTWIKDYKFKTRSAIQQIKDELSNIDVLIDKGEGNSDICSKRRDIFKSLQDIEKLHSSELSQKSKVKWAIGGDENSKYFHGVLNKNRNPHSIRGILVDGNWIETPSLVKKEFLSYFSNRFDRPPKFHLHNNDEFPNKLSPEQQSDLEINVTRNEIKKAIWDCGTDKSPGPDGFTFGFFRRYWSFLENDMIEAVNTFFINGNFSKGINSSFITLIPKNQEAKTPKDFRPITLIGCIYKIISKILANRMVFVLEDLKKQTMIFKVDFEKAYDSVRWDYLDDILRKFGFGEKWCSWIRNCLISSKGSILVNGSPTMEFQFHKGLKQGDPLSPFLFILVMESLHISISRVVEAGLFRRVQVGNDTQVSHLFFADDAVFMGHWSDSNIDIIIRILDCFYHASGLKINMSKSKLLGISVHRENVVAKLS